MMLELGIRLASLLFRSFLRAAAKDAEPTWVRIPRPGERSGRRQRYFRGLTDPNREGPPFA